MKGLFITFEGGEGAGKSTMIEKAREFFGAQGREVLLTREPGGTRLAERIRELVLGQEFSELCAETELLLVFAARAQHLAELIRPALNQGKVVLCDRFTDASWAYQGGGRGQPAEFIALLEQAVHGELQPDLTLLLDLPVTTGLTRMSTRDEIDRIEQESSDFFERVRAAYLQRAQQFPQRFRIIDAAQAKTAVWADIQRVLESSL
ncbi:MAG: dTMP kinase [Xanthomonadales bacterium]|nr:dTMP kinase [Xanthomonadales bacterium]